MKTKNIQVRLRDGVMGAHLAFPERTPAGAIIAIMEIWGVNDTMRHHAHEFAEAGFICLVPDLFWRQEPGVELSDKNPDHVQKAFDLYYEFDYDLGVRDMEDVWHYLQKLPECNGKVGAVGYCFGGAVVINMARTGTDLAAVAGFHASLGLNTPAPAAGTIKAKILILNGADDPFVKREQYDTLKKELDAAKADYKVIEYPGAVHAFTNPEATALGEKFKLPLKYDAKVDAESKAEAAKLFAASLKK